MNGSRITFLGSIEADLRSWLKSHPDGHEQGAFILFRKFDRYQGSARYLAIEVVKMEGDWVLGSSRAHLTINMRKLPELYFRCEAEGLELGFAHSHPSGVLEFSAQDDKNEQNILRGYAGCNGNGVALVSLVLCDDRWIARTRSGTERRVARTVSHVSVLGEHLQIHLPQLTSTDSEQLKRQEAAFGKPFNQKLNSLHAVVVGAGGTGSSLATLLARAGVGRITIVDGDNLEESNLNRVRGYKKSDVGKNKAATLAEFINSLDLTATASAIPKYLHESADAVDALSDADVVFGCTDDTTGRDILNQAVYYYAVPLLDLGLTGRVDLDDSGEPYLSDHRGRVSVVLPEKGNCLRCQKIVTDEKLAYEDAVRQRPELKDLDHETLREEYYLTGGGEQAPGVGPFTSMTADLAVSALMNLVHPFWKIPSDLLSDNIWIDFVHLCTHSNSAKKDPFCYCCQTGSITLKKEAGHRLDTPSLGRIS